MNLPTLHEVPFHGDRITAIIAADGRKMVAIAPICENLGIDSDGQIRNLTTTHAHWATTDIMSVVAKDGKQRELRCIPLDRLPMWLVNIKAGKVRPELREKIRQYQCEAADVLARYFTGQGDLSALGWETAFKAQTALVGQLQADLLALRTEVQRLADPIDRETARPAPSVPPGWFRLMQWAKMHKVYIHPHDQSAQGRIVADICRRSNFNPIYAKPPGDKRAGNYYPRSVLSKWMNRYFVEHPTCQPRYLFETN